MKRILSLFLVLCLFLPALSFAELDEEDLSFEDVSLDEDDEADAVDENEAEKEEAEPLPSSSSAWTPATRS